MRKLTFANCVWPRLLCVAHVALAGCTTVADYGRISDVKHAFLVKNEYLVVCVDGEILGQAGEHYVELPLDGTFLHPAHAVAYFNPFGPLELGIPQFRIPDTMVRKGCDPAALLSERVSVPVVRDVVIRAPERGDARSDPDVYRKKLAAAVREYRDSLKALDKDTGTVYLARKEDGGVLPNILYVSERSLYGGDKIVSFTTFTERTQPPDARMVLLYPLAFPFLAGGMGLATAMAALEHPSRSETSSEPKKSDPRPASKPPIYEGASDPLLLGKWRTAEGFTRYFEDGKSYASNSSACALEIEKSRMLNYCSHSLGSKSLAVWAYRAVAPGRYEFEVKEIDSVGDEEVGTKGTVEYSQDDGTLKVTLLRQPKTLNRGTIVKISTVYVRDRPRLAPISANMPIGLPDLGHS